MQMYQTRDEPLHDEKRLNSTGMESYAESPLNFSTHHYEDRILDLSEQLHNEACLKNTYEQALREVKSRLDAIERKDSERSREQTTAVNQQKASLEQREAALLSRLEQLERTNQELRQALIGETDPVEAALLDRLHHYKHEAQRALLLERELTRVQHEYDAVVLRNERLRAALEARTAERGASAASENS